MTFFKISDKVTTWYQYNNAIHHGNIPSFKQYTIYCFWK